MAIEAKECTALIGGAANSLDFIDGAVINNGDIAFTKTAGKFFYHRANTTGGLSEDSPIVIVPDTNPGSINWELASSNQLITIAKTSDFTVSTAYLQTGVTIVNTGAAGAVNATLPAAVVGYKISFKVVAAQYLKATAAGTEVFTYGISSSAAGGYVRNNTAGLYWSLECLNTGVWTITELNGILFYDE